jgi:hypothetical protein
VRRALVLAGIVLLLWGGQAGGQPAPGRRLSQVQVARQFLLAVLRADYSGAYGRLAPEVSRAISPAQFRAAARPLWARGQRKGTDIELYKLGFRLLGQKQTRGFVAFSFPADSLSKHPPEWLEVTFRDTASRQVLGFGLRKAGQ